MVTVNQWKRKANKKQFKNSQSILYCSFPWTCSLCTISKYSDMRTDQFIETNKTNLCHWFILLSDMIAWISSREISNWLVLIHDYKDAVSQKRWSKNRSNSIVNEKEIIAFLSSLLRWFFSFSSFIF